MSRDQRMKDNWALIYALEQAEAAGTNVAVVFNLVDKFLGAGARQFGFMLRGLKEMAPKLDAANIRFYLVQVRSLTESGQACDARHGLTERVMACALCQGLYLKKYLHFIMVITIS